MALDDGSQVRPGNMVKAPTHLQDRFPYHVSNIVYVGRKWIQQSPFPILEFGDGFITTSDGVFTRRSIFRIVPPRQTEIDEVVPHRTCRTCGMLGRASIVERLIMRTGVEHLGIHGQRVKHDVGVCAISV